MIGAPNTRGQKYWVGIVQWAAETSVSEEIADILTNYNIDKQIEEFQNFWSRASDDFEKRQALVLAHYLHGPHGEACMGQMGKWP